jgi:L-alanine-DL-glutamate epimerase-like enolase superfamily enzyme
VENPKITALEVATFRVPTDQPESDGTLEWNHTDVVTVHVHAGGQVGLGWTYASNASAALIDGILRETIAGRNPTEIETLWQAMRQRLRNAGLPGAGSMAIAAVDIALWDLTARLREAALVDLLSPVRDAVPLYGSGGFTSYSEARLCQQLSGWAEQGLASVKMKVGRDPEADPGRVAAARRAVPETVELFVDANGAYSRKQALEMAEHFAGQSRVRWFEEPRPSTDLDGLRLLRDRAPAGMDIAAGEYGDTLDYFHRMLESQAVDCLQADVTRCGGYTGFFKVGALCEAFAVPLSAHCAPQLHAHVGCAVVPLRHVEYFHDHVRIDSLLFEGALPVEAGKLRPDRSRPGHGMALKRDDAEKYRI